MREFRKFMGPYLRPYRKYIAWSVVTNILAALLNILAFSLIIPILRGLFGVQEASKEFIPWGELSLGGVEDLSRGADIILNNLSYYLQQQLVAYGPSQALLVLCLYLVGMTLLKSAATYLSLYLLIPISTGVVYRIRNKLNDKILSLPVSFMNEEHKGDILARISGDVNEVETSIVGALESMIRNPILIVLYFCTLLLISWKLTLFVLIVLPPAGFVMGRIGKILRRKSTVAHTQWGLLMSLVEETLSGLRVIKAFNAERFISRRFDEGNEAYRRSTHHMYARQQMAHPMSEFLGTIAIALILWYGGSLIFSGRSTISAATFIFYIIIFYHVITPAKELSKATYAVEKGMASIRRINEILAKPQEVRSGVNPQAAPRPVRFEQSIEFRDVSFAYAPGQPPVLEHIHLTIPKGKTVAFVGPSGAGKSTLADLLPRFHRPTSGAILMDGVDINTFAVEDLRELIGYVNQTPILFNDTIARNIAFSREGATRREVQEAAAVANAHPFITQLPQGYDTNIGDGGGKLSGGERQRISIARAVLKNPQILILDEATSALDNRSEQLVQEALTHLMKNRTTIVIAHRLSTILSADVICVIDNGRIAEQGSHEQLLARGGLYTALYETQFRHAS